MGRANFGEGLGWAEGNEALVVGIAAGRSCGGRVTEKAI